MKKILSGSLAISRFSTLLIVTSFFSISQVQAQTVLNNIDQLLDAMSGDNGNYRMAAGNYTVTEFHAIPIPAQNDLYAALPLTGNNNTFDFTGVTITIPVEALAENGISRQNDGNHTMVVFGDDNVVIGGIFQNTYNNSSWNTPENIDFVEYNEDRGAVSSGRSSVGIRVMGDDTELLNNTVTTRGSWPYGYGEIFGKGSGSVFGHSKHSGVLVNGDNTLIDGLDLNVQTFGHGIFVQGGSNTIIRNSSVEGVVRLGQEFYDDGPNSLPAQTNFEQRFEEWRSGLPIERDKQHALGEDGIRAYASGLQKDGSSASTGAIHVYNTEVINMRSGTALSVISDCTVDGVTLLGNSGGFTTCRGGDVINGRADAAHGPVLATLFYENLGSFDIEIIDAPHATGSHFLADISGRGGEINFTSNVENPVNVRAITLGYAWDRWDANDTENHTDDIELNNNTTYPVNLLAVSNETSGFSGGPITDNGTNNNLELREAPTTPASMSFAPDPNKTYYIDSPVHNLRLASDGESEDAYTTSTSVTGSDVEWKFVSKGNGYWHIQRAAGGIAPRLRTDNSEFADMQATTNNGTYTYYGFTQGASTGTHFLTLPDGPSNHQRLQVNSEGLLRFMSTSFDGTWESFEITEVASNERIVHIKKRNAQGFAIDGQGGAENGQSVYLWTENSNNINQQWIEIDRGNGYYTYQKQGTDYCIDGGNGGADRQDVYLWICADHNQNQHWEKVSTDSGFFQLVKRNAPGFAIDGGINGANAQNVQLYNSSNTSYNLQWSIE